MNKLHTEVSGVEIACASRERLPCYDFYSSPLTTCVVQNHGRYIPLPCWKIAGKITLGTKHNLRWHLECTRNARDLFSHAHSSSYTTNETDHSPTLLGPHFFFSSTSLRSRRYIMTSLSENAYRTRNTPLRSVWCSPSPDGFRSTPAVRRCDRG